MKQSSKLAKDAVSTLEAVADGRVAPQALVDSALDQWRAHSQVNSLIGSAPDTMNAPVIDEKAVLRGLLLAVKDNINTADFATSAGTPALADNRPKTNAPALQRLIDAGATVLGKANMHELAFGITSNNAFTGPVRNPHSHARIAGGSSGGTAAAIAAGIVPAGLGTDTGGSCRIPAALCGICGYRPTMGRYSGEGLVPICHTRDTVGPMAQSMRDLALLDSIMAGEPNRLPQLNLKGLRVGVPRAHFYGPLDEATAKITHAALDLLSNHGVELVEVGIANLAELNEAVGFPIVLFEVMQDLPAYLKTYQPKTSIEALVEAVASPDVKGVLTPLLGDGAIPREVYEEALNVSRPRLQKAYADYFHSNELTAMVFPTTPRVASLLGEDETVMLGGAPSPTFPTFIRNCDPGSNAGIPSVSVPAGVSSEGLPVGLSFDGPIGADRTVLALASAFEQLQISA